MLHSPSRLASLSLVMALAGAVAFGCAAGSEDDGVGPDDGGGNGAGGAGGSAGGSPNGGMGGEIQVGGSGGVPVEPVIYAHTDDTLYELDIDNNFTLTPVGAFDCVGGNNPDNSMNDVAVGADASLFGVSANFVWPLTEASCGSPIALQNPENVRFYGLTFAPVGVLHAQKEVLVGGNTAGELWSISDTGQITQRGTFGTVPNNDGNGNDYLFPGEAWELSGDIVFVEGAGNPLGFATVRDCPNPPFTSGCNEVNTLIEIDVPAMATASTQPVVKSVRGQIVKAAGCNDGTNGNYGNMYGIAALGAKVYGFSRSGNIVEINIDDGSACLVKADPTLPFAGAGLTTKAIVDTPIPK